MSEIRTCYYIKASGLTSDVLLMSWFKNEAIIHNVIDCGLIDKHRVFDNVFRCACNGGKRRLSASVNSHSNEAHKFWCENWWLSRAEPSRWMLDVWRLWKPYGLPRFLWSRTCDSHNAKFVDVSTGHAHFWSFELKCATHTKKDTLRIWQNGIRIYLFFEKKRTK